MKILESMLKNFIDVPNDILEITNQKIIEVESFGPANEATKLVIGKVLTCEKHPNADSLSLTTVDLGDRVEQIVCGAANVRKDQYVIVAQVGTILPGNFEIKATKIRGEVSHGMICSLNELGFDEKIVPEEFKDGIYVFDEEKKIGSPALDALGLDGFVMELGLTPNRGDLLSVYGFAKDLSAMTNQKMKEISFHVKEIDKNNPIQIRVETKNCTDYHARMFESVVVKESPWWLKNALLKSDIKPINNVVDISNYVMLEYGTPLHMFDYQKLESNEIVVRQAKTGETCVTLDGISRTLNADDLLITDGIKPIAIGGVMGLENSMITEKTTQIVLEAARFDPKAIQKTTKRLNLKSDSSLRFERGVDPKRVILGLARASELLIELADAKVLKGIQSVQTNVDPIMITIPKGSIESVLGIQLKKEELLSYFERFDYLVSESDLNYVITPPSDRSDLLIPADIIEEVARMYGLNNIPMAPIKSPTFGKLSDRQKRIRGIRHHLSCLGFHEVITYSLLKTDEVNLYQTIGEPVSVLMPLSEDKKTLRQSLVNGLLDTISYNQNRKRDDLAIYEIGNVFAKNVESLSLGIAMSGIWHKNPWTKESVETNFFVLKGILDSLFNPLGIELNYVTTQEIESYHPYQQAQIIYKDQPIGYLATINPKRAQQLGIETTYLCELNLDLVVGERQVLNYQAPSKYPQVSRDLAIVIDEEQPVDGVLAIIRQTVKKQLSSLEVFDIYQGEHIESKKKSVAFRLTFSDSEKTLSNEDVEALMKKIIGRLQFQFKAVVRG